jgi:hypothetical protein
MRLCDIDLMIIAKSWPDNDIDNAISILMQIKTERQSSISLFRIRPFEEVYGSRPGISGMGDCAD